jgi:hypothetical protein
VKLREGWRYDSASRSFISAEGATFAPGADLPGVVRIVPTVPHLAQADPKRLIEDERELARFVQVILPKGSRQGPYLERIAGWPCVERASPGPEVSLPM